MIGEIDILNERDYIYTLRSKTPNASAYIINKSDFLA